MFEVEVRSVMAGLGQVKAVGKVGEARRGKAGQGKAVVVRRGVVGSGKARLGEERRSWRGWVRRGKAWRLR
jgi:hypothetical protein